MFFHICPSLILFDCFHGPIHKFQTTQHIRTFTQEMTNHSNCSLQ